MPFTFSHPAIILPLRYLPKSWFSLTGLIIGSLTPDFEYFLRMKVKSNYSHTLCGIFWFDLPFALLLTFVFHNLMRNCLFQNLPPVIKKRILVFSTFNWNVYFQKNWLIVLISLFLGIISHILWDGFTHEYGYFVNQIEFFRNTFTVFGKEIPLWKFLQHGSTIIGAIIIIITFLKLPQNFNFNVDIQKSYWITVLLFTSAVLFIRFIVNPKALNIGNFVVSFIAALLISMTIIPFLIKFQSGNKN